MGKSGRVVALYIINHLESMEQLLWMDEEMIEILWVKGKVRDGDVIVGLCCRPPDQEDQMNEGLYKQIETASRSEALMGDFTCPNIFWKEHTTRHQK